MIHLKITLDTDSEPWESDAIYKDTLKENGIGALVAVGRFPNGTQAGKSTVAVAIRMEDGRLFCGETTAALFLLAAGAIKGAEDRLNES